MPVPAPEGLTTQRCKFLRNLSNLTKHQAAHVVYDDGLVSIVAVGIVIHTLPGSGTHPVLVIDLFRSRDYASSRGQLAILMVSSFWAFVSSFYAALPRRAQLMQSSTCWLMVRRAWQSSGRLGLAVRRDGAAGRLRTVV